MTPRRRIAIVAFTALAVVAFGLWGAGRWWWMYSAWSGRSPTLPYVSVTIVGGGVTFLHGSDSTHLPSERSILRVRRPNTNWWFSYTRRDTTIALFIPLWVVWLPSGVAAVWLWRTAPRGRGGCPACGYDTAGLDTCPECGSPLPRA